jgi:putative transposase
MTSGAWDFVADECADGRRFRALTVLDLYTRECLAIAAGQSLTGQDVAATLERLRFERACPSASTATTAPSS